MEGSNRRDEKPRKRPGIIASCRDRFIRAARSADVLTLMKDSLSRRVKSSYSDLRENTKVALASYSTMPAFLQVDGNQIVLDGKPVLLKGDLHGTSQEQLG